MAQLPILSGKTLIKALSKLGYREARQPYSPVLPGTKAGNRPELRYYRPCLLRKILRDIELDPEELLKLL